MSPLPSDVMNVVPEVGALRRSQQTLTVCLNLHPLRPSTGKMVGNHLRTPPFSSPKCQRHVMARHVGALVPGAHMDTIMFELCVRYGAQRCKTKHCSSSDQRVEDIPVGLTAIAYEQ